MATHFSLLAWRIPMDRGAWRATVHGVARVGHDLVTKPPHYSLSQDIEDSSVCYTAGPGYLSTLCVIVCLY